MMGGWKIDSDNTTMILIRMAICGCRHKESRFFFLDRHAEGFIYQTKQPLTIALIEAKGGHERYNLSAMS
jgi:hypothetical protein